jgi:diacylglycerol kinase (ATP)
MAAASSADADPARRVQIVVTPGSGEGRAASTARRLARKLQRRGVQPDVRSFKDLAALVHWARTCDRDFGLLVCVGGDATLSASAEAAIRLDVPFVPVPNGFGNVFARVFGHSDRDVDVVRLLDDREFRRVDVGVVRSEAAEEIFLSHRSYGFLEHIQHVAERGRQQPKNRLLRYLWYWGVAQQLLFASRLWGFAVEVDGTLVAEDAVLVTVANVETYRGFLPLTPKASPIDGLFDVFVMPRVSTRTLMRRLVWLMLRLPGRWHGVRLYRGKHVVVTTPRRRDRLVVRRAALPLLVPRGAIDALRQRVVSDDAPVERP